MGEKKKVYLLKPRWSYPTSKDDYTYNRIWFPLSLSYCSSLLRENGFQPVVYDFHAQRNLDIRKEVSRVASDDIVFVTSSDLDRWQCPHLDLEPFLQVVKMAQVRTSNVFVIGPHGTMKPEEILRKTQAKALIRGEPELRVLEIAQGKNLDGIAGVSHLQKGVVVHTPDAPNIELDKLPIPDFSCVDQANYFYDIFGERSVVLETSRNCPYQCTFCFKNMFGTTYRVKSPQRMVQEIKSAIHAGAKRGIFMDLEFALDRRHVERLCHALIEETPGFEWCCSTRLDDLDADLIELMAQAGCRLIHFGLESADQELLNSTKKRLDLARTQGTLELCKRNGIQTLLFLIIGFPGESLDQAKKTLAFARDVNPNYISIHLVTQFSGTELFDEQRNPDGFYYQEPDPVRLKQFKMLRRWGYLSYYLRPRYLLNNLHFSHVRNPRRSLSQLRLFLSFLK